MKKNKSLLKLVFLLFGGVLLLTSGCSDDSMDNIEIVVTNYPNEYVVKKLYGNHSTITSIYPDGVDIDDYEISTKQKEDWAFKDLFIYNGLLDKERDLAVDLLEINPDLKIIDTAYVLEVEYSPEELWLNPSSLLMMSQNVRIGLLEYITSKPLKDTVNEEYDKLKIELSELDANYRVAVDSTNNKKIIVSDNSLKYLEKFGLEVVSLDIDASLKVISDTDLLFANANNSYIITFKGNTANENVVNLMTKYTDVKTLELHKLDNITDEERSEKLDYISIMNENLELIKKELYQ